MSKIKIKTSKGMSSCRGQVVMDDIYIVRRPKKNLEKERRRCKRKEKKKKVNERKKSPQKSHSKNNTTTTLLLFKGKQRSSRSSLKDIIDAFTCQTRTL